MPVGEQYDTASAFTAPFVGSYTPDAESDGTQAYIRHGGYHWLAEPIIGGGSDMSSYVAGTTESVGLYVHRMDGTGYSVSYPVMLPIWFNWVDDLSGFTLGGPDFLCSWEHLIYRSAWNCGVPRGGGLVGCAFASDGTNLWLAVVTRSEEPYPYYHSRYGFPFMEPETLEALSAAGNYFAYQGSFPFCGGSGPGSWDDLGVTLSQRWRPASLFMYVWNGAGFTQIGRVQGQFETDYLESSTLDRGGRVGPPELAASPAEPGVCHALWSENGQYGRRVINPPDSRHGWPYRGSRLVYSSWSAGAKLSENDVLRFDIQDIAPDPPPDLPAMPWWTLTPDCRAIDQGGGSTVIYPFHGMQGLLAWTPYYAIRNDHGSPILFVSKQQIWPARPFLFNADGSTTAGGESTIHAMLPDGTILQSLTTDLLPTAAENAYGPQGAVTPDRVFGDAFAPESSRSGLLSVSSLYHDPLLGGTAVYLLQVRWGFLDVGASFIADAGEGMYRIPCDGSAPFSLLDGDRNLAILPNVNHLQSRSRIRTGPYVPIADFFSETKSVWVPSPVGAGGFFDPGLVYQLDRVCELDWVAWVPFTINPNGCPRSLPYYSPAASAFYWPDRFENLTNSRIIPNVCGPTGLHIWHRSPDHR